MIRCILAFTLISTLFLNSLGAQELPCGTSLDSQLVFRPRLLQNVINAENSTESGVVQYVPVHFHLVADEDGKGRIRIAKALEAICQLNAAFEDTDLQFFIAEHPQYGLFDQSINSDNVYSQQTNLFAMHSRRHLNAVNVYIVSTPVANIDQPGVTLAYYSPGFDWIVIRKDQVTGNTSNLTFPHEVGHFFSLNHTFFGYESNPFDPQDSSWPSAPVISPGNIPTERANGTNCTTAGDAICDTPPDYNFGFTQGNCNNYSGGALDPLDQPVDPQENNFMSYFLGCSEYEFSPKQIDVMEADFQAAYRNYLQNNYQPQPADIISPTDLLISPINGETVNAFNNVYLNWKAVAGATHYLLELDVLPTFGSPLQQTHILESNGILLDDLDQNRFYYWRVRPFNLNYGCANFRQSSFKTGVTTSTTTLQGVNSWSVSPNPVTSGSPIRINLDLEDSAEVLISLYNFIGQRIAGEAVAFQAGTSQYTLDIPRLAEGSYILSLEHGSKVQSRRLVVLR